MRSVAAGTHTFLGRLARFSCQTGGGRRIDVVLISGPEVFVIEFKVRSADFDRAAKRPGVRLRARCEELPRGKPLKKEVGVFGLVERPIPNLVFCQLMEEGARFRVAAHNVSPPT
jgi:hypothetical protein